MAWVFEGQFMEALWASAIEAGRFAVTMSASLPRDPNSNTHAPPRRPAVDRVAFLISALTSPFLVAAVTACLAVWYVHPSVGELVVWSAIATTFAVFIPFAVVFLLWRWGLVTDMHVALREQRGVPFAAAVLSAAIGWVVLARVGAPAEFLAMGASLVASGIALAVMTLRRKVSVHAGAYCACVLALAMLETPAFAFALLGLPLVFWARMHRDRHTLKQGIAAVIVISAIAPVAYYGVLALLGGT